MISYIIKSTICLMVFYGVYELLFSRIKTFHLNRFMLLIFFTAAITIPLVTIYINSVPANVSDAFPLLLKPLGSQSAISEKLSVINYAPVPSVKTLITEVMLVAVYVAALFILLYRFSKNIYSVIALSKSGARGIISGHKIVLLEENVSPHSFLKTIFISRKDYESGTISESLINHEIAHIRQLHSVDIIFIELISAFFWFNPVVYLYKRAVKLNHEYLADSYVLNNGDSVPGYSDMLLNYSSSGKYIGLISGINYSFIKKRINMLVKPNNRTHLRIRLSAAVFISAGLFLFIVTGFRVISVRNPDPINTFSGTYSGYRTNDTIMYNYGEFIITSETGKTTIKAHRLMVSSGLSLNKNYFENDFMNGKVYNDGVDINTNNMFLDKIISYKADNIEKADSNGVIILRGNAEVKGEDVSIKSDQITLYLSQWKISK
jgi:hypothetical protein